MRNATQGWYTFADGHVSWFRCLSQSEKRIEERKHGKVIRFQPTWL